MQTLIAKPHVTLPFCSFLPFFQQPELEDSFTLSKLENFLASIPDNIPSTKIIQWLREDFVPFILTKIPEGQV